MFIFLSLLEDDIQLIAKCFLWPREMDAILDAAMGRINLQRDIVETSLKKRKSKFEET